MFEFWVRIQKKIRHINPELIVGKCLTKYLPLVSIVISSLVVRSIKNMRVKIIIRQFEGYHRNHPIIIISEIYLKRFLYCCGTFQRGLRFLANTSVGRKKLPEVKDILAKKNIERITISSVFNKFRGTIFCSFGLWTRWSGSHRWYLEGAELHLYTSCTSCKQRKNILTHSLTYMGCSGSLLRDIEYHCWRKVELKR